MKKHILALVLLGVSTAGYGVTGPQALQEAKRVSTSTGSVSFGTAVTTPKESGSLPKISVVHKTYNANGGTIYVGRYSSCSMTGFNQGTSSDALRYKQIYTSGSADGNGRYAWYIKNDAEYTWQWVKVACFNFV